MTVQYVFLKNVSEKEMQILELIDNNEFVTLASLDFLFKTRQNVYTYMVNLTNKKKLVEKKKVQGCLTMWFLSDTGKQYLKAKGTYLDTVKIDYHPQDTFYHSIGLTNLEVILKRDYDIEQFVSDRYLHKYFADNKKKYRLEYSGYPRIPDMEFSIDGNKYAFELELSKKSRYRYFKMFHFYRDFERYDQVIWVCKDKKMLNYVLKRYLKCLSDSIVRVAKDNEVGLKKIERSKSIHLFATYAEFMKKGMKSLKPLSDYLPGEIPQEKKERIRTNMTELKRTLVT